MQRGARIRRRQSALKAKTIYAAGFFRGKESTLLSTTAELRSWTSWGGRPHVRAYYLRFLGFALAGGLDFATGLGFAAGLGLAAGALGLAAGLGFSAFAGFAGGGSGFANFFPDAGGSFAGTGAAAAAKVIPAALSFSLPFPFPLVLPVSGGAATTTGTAMTAAFAARPRRGGGGGGGGGGASGLRYFIISGCERSLPSRRSRKTPWAMVGYSGMAGVMRSSVISRSGMRFWTSRHLVKKFRILLVTACCLELTARNRMASGREPLRSCQVFDGVAASLPERRLARSLEARSSSFQPSTRPLRGMAFSISWRSFSASFEVRKCRTAGDGSV